jgi:hypothetical protein
MQISPGNRSKSFQDGIQLQSAQNMHTNETEEATATARSLLRATASKPT